MGWVEFVIEETPPQHNGHFQQPLHTHVLHSMDRAVFVLAVSSTHPVGPIQQQLHMPTRRMDRPGFAIATIATPQQGPIRQLLYTFLYPMDRAVFVLAATAIHQVGHIEQPIYTHLCPMDKAVIATETNARCANSLQQQPHRKHAYPNGSRESETIGGIPISHISQLTYIHVLRRSPCRLVTKMLVLSLTPSP